MAGKPYLIAGAGIAGLAAAIALAAKGFSVRVAEAREAAEEAGAGIQLGPNALRALQAIGVPERLRARAHAPPSIDIHGASHGRRIASLPLGEEALRRFGAPYWTVSRQDLHAALAAVAAAQPSIRIERGFCVAALRQGPDEVVLRSSDGRELAGSALIGADGVRSAVRTELLGEAPPRFTGHVAWRATVDRVAADEPFSAPSVGLWLGASAHLVHYPIDGGTRVNVVAVVAQGMAEPGPPQTVFAGWAGPARRLIGGVSAWRAWPLYERDASLPAAKGAAVLIGDAAHPVLPFLAQGAALALEDAVALADWLAEVPSSPGIAIDRFLADRRRRWLSVQRRSRQNGRVYHLSGPLAAARDLVLSHAPPGQLIGRYQWLYGHGRGGESFQWS